MSSGRCVLALPWCCTYQHGLVPKSTEPVKSSSRAGRRYSQQSLTAFGSDIIHLYVLAEPQVRQLEVCCRTPWQMHQQHAIDRLAVLIEDNHICKTSIGRILTDLLQCITLKPQEPRYQADCYDCTCLPPIKSESCTTHTCDEHRTVYQQ